LLSKITALITWPKILILVLIYKTTTKTDFLQVFFRTKFFF
jgi:hypothetical protein